MTLLDIPLLSKDQPWHLLELASWGIVRAEEADARGFPFIVVAQISAGSGRISSRVAEHGSIVSVWRESARRERAAFAVLERGRDGWSISEFFNCVGDVDDVTARLATIAPLERKAGGRSCK